jgi:outer membrane lipase/esterase
MFALHLRSYKTKKIIRSLHMSSLLNVRIILVFLFSLSVSGLSHASYSQIISFGDSLSDTGNVFTATGSPPAPYYNGNFSNGPVWVERLATQLGVAAPQASLAGGTNYSWGGARTTINAPVPSTQSQLLTYLTDVGGVADSNALYTILTGGNDLQAFAGGSSGVPQLLSDAQAVATFATDLINAGAQNILILNVPDLGTAPVSDGNEGLATAFTQLFNDELETSILGLNSSKVKFLDLFTLTQELVADPVAAGLSNVTESCLAVTGGAGGAICDQFLFWDDIHPTAVGHQLIADAAFSTVVPVPAAAWLFGSALIGLAGVARRK